MKQTSVASPVKEAEKTETKAFQPRKKCALKTLLTYGIVAVLSAVIFCCTFGFRVLDPTYTDWLMTGESIPQFHFDVKNPDYRPYGRDLKQHYMGWKAYRTSAWHFPIGMIDNLAYPEQVSMIYVDCIPLFAVFFKILSPILPASFQYFGLWGILCFILQGVLALRILKKYTVNPLIAIPASLLFVLVPAMIRRMFFHTALAGQWILLLAIEPIFNDEKYRQNPRKLYILTCLIGVLTAFIHLYFTLMCGIILLGVCLQDILKRKTAKRSLALIGLYILFAAAATALLGGFSSPVEGSYGGLGAFSFNLNGFINPLGWSTIFQTRPLLNHWQYEGFAYLGAGCLLLAFAAFILFLASGRAKELWLRHWKTAAALLAIMIISVAFAASPFVTLGNRLLYIEPPQWLWDLWSIFRATGRVAWGPIYIVMLCSCVAVCKLLDKRGACVLLAAMLAVQIYDIHPALQQKRQSYGNERFYETPLADAAFWEDVANDPEIRHIVFYSSPGDAYMYAFADFATDHGKTVNDFYFARPVSPELLEKNLNTALQTLPEDTLFIFMGEDRENAAYRDYSLFCYDVDGLVVGRSKPIGNFEIMQ